MTLQRIVRALPCTTRILSVPPTTNRYAAVTALPIATHVLPGLMACGGGRRGPVTVLTNQKQILIHLVPWSMRQCVVAMMLLTATSVRLCVPVLLRGLKVRVSSRESWLILPEGSRNGRHYKTIQYDTLVFYFPAAGWSLQV